MKPLLLVLLLLGSAPVSLAQLRSDIHAAPSGDGAMPVDTLSPAPAVETGLYLTLDGLGLGNGLLGNDQIGGTLGYRFTNGFEVGAGIHRQRAFIGSSYTLGATAGYTHALSSQSGIRSTARLTGTFGNLYDEETDASGFQGYQAGSQQLRMLRADLDVAAYHRLDLTRWMSVTPSAGVFATGTRHANRDALSFRSHVGEYGLLVGLHTGLDLTFRLSDKVSLTLPLRIRLFPQRIADDRTAPGLQQPTFGTGIRIDF